MTASKFPRWFVHVDGFQGETEFIRCDSETESSLVFKDGSEHKSQCDDWFATALHYTSIGVWRELTEDEAREIISQ
jgi:hypothetical protein